MNRRDLYQVLDLDFDEPDQDLTWWHTSRLAALAVAARTGLAEGEEEARHYDRT